MVGRNVHSGAEEKARKFRAQGFACRWRMESWIGWVQRNGLVQIQVTQRTLFLNQYYVSKSFKLRLYYKILRFSQQGF